MEPSMKNRLLVGCTAILSAVLGYGQATGPQHESPRTAAASTTSGASASPTGRSNLATAQRALLDQYCVTCHNDKTKRANLTLEKLDLTTVGDNPQLWEKVVRKLRAGVMPPPGMRRPDWAAYSGLTEWLEAEIDRKEAAHINPGTKVLHRLNRAEYANAIRDLLDLEIDPATLIPADD